MRPSAVCAVLSLAACAAAPADTARVPTPPPDVARVLSLAPGTRVQTELAPGLPDEPQWRVAAVWWREALRQSIAFDVGDEPGGPGAVTLVLAIDEASRRLASFCKKDGVDQALAGETFADGDLAAAIDRLAWGSRLAIGERVQAPVPVALCVSPSHAAVLATVDGYELLQDGGIEGGRRAFLAARRSDGGSPFVLDGLATVALMRGEVDEAERLGREALGYEARLSPTTQHRLARTLLLARASRDPSRAPDRDRELLTLGQVFARERPHDPQGQLTVAIAHNFLAEFAASRPILEHLRSRFPRQAIVPYHLGWACLATGDAAAAIAHFEAAAVRLPMAWVAIPRAIAHHTAGDSVGLRKLLERLVDDSDPRAAESIHDLRRMQAAQALLDGDRDAAAAGILADLNLLLANPSLLERRPGEFAEMGEVLVRLGGAQALRPLLGAVQGQHPGTAVADASAYLSGLVHIAGTQQRALELEGRLDRGGESVFALRLQAFAHELRGELADMHAALARAVRMSDTPLTKVLLARSLDNMGRPDDARALREALRRELVAIHLRRRPTHPILGPELAFAFRN